MIRIAVTWRHRLWKKLCIKQLFGYPVFNADKEVVKIYKKNRKCFKKLKKKFPKFISFPIKKKWN